MFKALTNQLQQRTARGRLQAAPPARAGGAEKSMLGGGAPAGGGVAGTSPTRYNDLVREAYTRNVIGYRAARLVAQTVATLPLLERRGTDDHDEGPLLAKLDRPNLSHTRSTFLETLVLYLLYGGDSFLLGRGVYEGREPEELWPQMPPLVELVTARGYPMPTAFKVRTGGGSPERFEVDLVTGRCDILRITHPHPAGDLTERGVPALGPAAGRVDLHNAGTAWNFSVLRRGGRPSGAFIHEEELDDEQFEHLREEVDRMVSGADQVGRPLVLDGGLKWEDLSASPHDMDWLEGQRDAARDIALSAGVPPQLVGIPDSQTYSNYREARLALYEDTVLPMAEHLLASLSQWLGPAMGLEPGHRLAVDVDNVPALSVRRERYWEKVESSTVLTINEKRAELGYDPIVGGDELYEAPNKVPLSMLEDGIGLGAAGGDAAGQEPGGEEPADPSGAVRRVLEDMDAGELDQDEAVGALAEALGVARDVAEALLEEADQRTNSDRRARRSLARARNRLEAVK